MSVDPEAAIKLADEISQFKTWADGLADTPRSAEWESEYPDWQRLYEAAKVVLHMPVTTWSDDDVSGILYAIARDSESEFLIEQASQQPAGLLRLARSALSFPDCDARWQVAAALGAVNAEHVAAAEQLLLTLVDDEDNYVKRRALASLAMLNSSHTEAQAELAWNSGDEYRRISCLHALRAISSGKISEYLKSAPATGQGALMQVAREIEAKMS